MLQLQNRNITIIFVYNLLQGGYSIRDVAGRGSQCAAARARSLSVAIGRARARSGGLGRARSRSGSRRPVLFHVESSRQLSCTNLLLSNFSPTFLKHKTNMCTVYTLWPHTPVASERNV